MKQYICDLCKEPIKTEDLDHHTYTVPHWEDFNVMCCGEVVETYHVIAKQEVHLCDECMRKIANIF